MENYMARYKQEDRKEIALKKLITLAKKKDFDLVATYEDYHKGKRGWPIKWYEYLEYTDINADPQKIQKVLDDTLYRITTADFPVSLKQMQKEKALFRLTLDAGANPNLEYHSKIFFSLLVNENKIHFAFELAKREGFYFSDNADKIFEPLAYNISPDNFGNFSDWIGVNPFRQNLSEEVAAFKTVIDFRLL